MCSLPSLAESGFDKTWQYANLYDDDKGNYFKLSGRLHMDSAWFDADQGKYNDLIWRRLRFGFTGQWGQFKSVVETDINLNESLKDSYNRLTDAKVSWKASDPLTVTVLKQSAGFTLDGKTSSRRLYTPQRNNLTNNLWFTAEYFTGLSAKGDLGSGYSYLGGVYSTDDSDEIGVSNGSYFTLMSFGKEWDSAAMRLDYVYNDLKADSNTRSFTNVVSLSGKMAIADWRLSTDLAYGEGGLGQADVFGLVFMPIYHQSEKLQWVMRYTYLDSDGDNGIRLGRYENAIVDGRGDGYQEAYGGANYMIHEHKLKLQLGMQYTLMDDNAKDGGEYDGWGMTLALRSYW